VFWSAGQSASTEEQPDALAAARESLEDAAADAQLQPSTSGRPGEAGRAAKPEPISADAQMALSDVVKVFLRTYTLFNLDQLRWGTPFLHIDHPHSWHTCAPV
jgi:hypothetical protein